MSTRYPPVISKKERQDSQDNQSGRRVDSGYETTEEDKKPIYRLGGQRLQIRETDECYDDQAAVAAFERIPNTNSLPRLTMVPKFTTAAFDRLLRELNDIGPIDARLEADTLTCQYSEDANENFSSGYFSIWTSLVPKRPIRQYLQAPIPVSLTDSNLADLGDEDLHASPYLETRTASASIQDFLTARSPNLPGLDNGMLGEESYIQRSAGTDVEDDGECMSVSNATPPSEVSHQASTSVDRVFNMRNGQTWEFRPARIVNNNNIHVGHVTIADSSAISSAYNITFDVSACLYVCQLHPNVTETVLVDIFSPFGPVLYIRVYRDDVSLQSLGYAHVIYNHVCDAEKAFSKLNYFEIEENPCHMRVAYSPMVKTESFPVQTFINPRFRNPNYRGQTTIGSNQNPLLPQELNCAVWIQGLHPDTTVTDLLGSFKNVGRVFTTHINKPNKKHKTSAAKIAFFRPDQAQRFLALTILPGGLKVLNQPVNACLNRNKYSPHRKPWESRVLHIRGPAEWVNPEFLEEYMRRLMRLDIIHAKYVNGSSEDSIREMEWCFGSVLAQAQAAKLAIDNERGFGKRIEVNYLPDPCE